jgi:predicted regulator of Ras-like GTPase activity (Roadblock/LC7/MglB family)
MTANIVENHQQSEPTPFTVVEADNTVFSNLAATLAEIRKLKGVLGYILRNNTAAIIDLTQKESTTEYAILSSQIHESSKRISKQFKLTDVESALVEGQTAKLLCMCIGENRIAVFMDKKCAHDWIVKRILL